MFSLNEKGNSILVHIKNFTSYFYVEVPDKLDTDNK